MRFHYALLLLLIFTLTVQARSTGSTTKDSGNSSTDIKTAPWFVERFRLTGGFFLPVSNTDIQIGVNGGRQGTEVDFEKDLGFKSTNGTFLGELQWRITRRSRLGLNYYNIPRNSTYRLDKEINFNGQIYPVDATVKSFFNTAIYQVSYGYAFVSKPKLELGVLVGTHLVGGKVGISLTAENLDKSASNDYGFTAPLPDLGLWGGFAVSNRLALNFDVNYLALTVGEVTGSILTYNLLFIYKIFDKLDLSLGYAGLNFSVEVVKPDVEAHFDWGYNGPALGLSYTFGKKTWKH
jgi:hypothetical protein